MAETGTSETATDIVFRSDVDVELVDSAGSDLSFAAAARVSTGKDRQTSDDPEAHAGLIRHLMRNRHGSPFEHASLQFRIEAPIFVFREFMRHRVGWSYNETSGRYRELQPHFYVPRESAVRTQTGKAANYTMAPMSPQDTVFVQSMMREAYQHAYDSYQVLLREGVARELARSVLPVATYSSMYATCNPRSLMHFLSLRTNAIEGVSTFESKPQLEIAMVASKLEALFSMLFPITYRAWHESGRVAP